MLKTRMICRYKYDTRTIIGMISNREFKANIEHDMQFLKELLIKEDMYDPIFPCYNFRRTRMHRDRVEIMLVMGDIIDDGDLPTDLSMLWYHSRTSLDDVREYPSIKNLRNLYCKTLDGHFWDETLESRLVEEIKHMKILILTNRSLPHE